MPIIVTCPCGTSLRAPDSASGKKIKCPKCSSYISIPKEESIVTDLDIEPDHHHTKNFTNNENINEDFKTKEINRSSKMVQKLNKDFVCPYCDHVGLPVPKEKITMAGWAVFGILLLCCLPLCWLPFVVDAFKEKYRFCIACENKVA